MSLKYDSDLLEAMKRFTTESPELRLRNILDGSPESGEIFLKLLENTPTFPDVDQKIYETKASDGHTIQIYGFTKRYAADSSSHQQVPTSAVLHIHGGGMVSGSVPDFAQSISARVSSTEIPFFSVEYRLAPGNRHPVPVEDCYQSLVWLYNNATELNIDPARIGLVGESSGGGLAAGVALMARDRGLSPPLAKQILFYPMIDDRNLTPIPALEQFATWTTEQNAYGWQSLLENKAGQDDVSPYAAVARASSVEGLPSTYIDVGGLDIFRDEDLEYATRLLAANVDTEFHLYPGLPHGFELFGVHAGIVAKVEVNRLKAIKSF